jgi:hypothetical protein
LYRQQFDTFEAYCRERWNLDRRRAYQLLDAAEVAENLLCTTGTQPQTERQARPLTRLEPEVQREVWQAVVEETPPEQITAKVVEEKAKAAEPLNEAVKAIKEELKPEPPAPAQQPILPDPPKPKDPVMVAAAAVSNVSHGTQTAPQTESQARPLTRLEPKFRTVIAFVYSPVIIKKPLL